MRKKTTLEHLDAIGEVKMSMRTMEESDRIPEYRSTNAKRNPYRNRKFLAVDGEGVNHPEKAPIQSYVLLGVSDGESSDDVSNYDLSTYECLQFLINMQNKYPDHIKVAFSFGYDVTMILKDFTEKQKEKLFDGGTVLHCGFRVRYLKGKWLEIWQAGVYTKIFDVFSFFTKAFMKACDEYIGIHELYQELAAEVDSGKRKRNDFQYNELDSIIRPYMHKELQLLVLLMTKLREYLASIDLHLSSWHGPGAVASMLLQKHKIRKYRPEREHDYVCAASQYAYAGGRFESFKTGLYYGDVYGYDIRSAYPYALTQVPALDSDFDSSDDIDNVPDFALCRVTYFNLSIPRTGINPLPLRSARGAIYYPNAVTSWVWGCEYKVAKKWFPDSVECSEVIRFNDNGIRPFDFVNDLFSERQQFKSVGNPVQLVCKLGMNSLYGKLAQLIGWDEVNRLAPRYHQLRWAGFATSMCRSMVLDAMMQAPEAIIATETDGIYSEKPLVLDIGKNLGQFEESHYDGMLFMQSGVYFTLEHSGDWSAGKTRGFTPNNTNVEVAMSTVRELSPVTIEQRRFHGLPGAMHSPKERSWTDEPRILQWGGGGKRFHRSEYCSGCANGDSWHNTAWTIAPSPLSHKHELPWMVKP